MSDAEFLLWECQLIFVLFPDIFPVLFHIGKQTYPPSSIRYMPILSVLTKLSIKFTPK